MSCSGGSKEAVSSGPKSSASVSYVRSAIFECEQELTNEKVQLTIQYVDEVFDAWTTGACAFALQRRDSSRDLCLLCALPQLNRAAVACRNASIRLAQD
jgi:hypothetical protein